MKNAKYLGFEYPKKSDSHIMKLRLKKRRINVDASYKFINNGMLFRLASAIARALAWTILPVVSFLWMHLSIRGKKHWRAVRKKGVLIVSNHVHALDAAGIAACMSRRRKVRIVTLKDNVNIPVSGPVIRFLGGIPLGGTYGGQKKFSRAVDSLLQNKKPVLFFPEAALWPYYTALRPFWAGAFGFAVKNDVPLLPVAYTFKINKRDKKHRLVMNILPPVYPNGRTSKELMELIHGQMLDTMRCFYSCAKNNKSGKPVPVQFGEVDILANPVSPETESDL